MMLCGMKTVEVPLFGGKEFAIINAFLESSPTTRLVTAIFHGTVLMLVRTRSFTVKIMH